MVQGQSSKGVVDGDEGQVIDCLEHVRRHVLHFFHYLGFLTLCQVVQALAWTKACMNKRAVGAVEGAHVAELEQTNTKLLAELPQTHLALTEAKAARNSLFVNYGKMEWECAGLHAAVDSLRQEKTEAVAAHEAEITTVHKTFQDYRVRHHKKLCEFWVNLEKEVNENGV
jgi:hypothetical protein